MAKGMKTEETVAGRMMLAEAKKTRGALVTVTKQENRVVTKLVMMNQKRTIMMMGPQGEERAEMSKPAMVPTEMKASFFGFLAILLLKEAMELALGMRTMQKQEEVLLMKMQEEEAIMVQEMEMKEVEQQEMMMGLEAMIKGVVGLKLVGMIMIKMGEELKELLEGIKVEMAVGEQKEEMMVMAKEMEAEAKKAKKEAVMKEETEGVLKVTKEVKATKPAVAIPGTRAQTQQKVQKQIRAIPAMRVVVVVVWTMVANSHKEEEEVQFSHGIVF